MNASGDLSEHAHRTVVSRGEIILAKLEDHLIQLKTTSGNIMRKIYNITSQLDIWMMLHQLDTYLNSPRKKAANNPSSTPEREEEEEIVHLREASKIMECLQESQAVNAQLWTPVLCLFAISIFQTKFESLAIALKGKREFRPEDLVATECNISKLYRFERQIGEGRYSSVHIVESKQDHKFYAMKKIALYALTPYELTALKVGCE